MELLEVKDVTKQFGNLTALRDVNLSLPSRGIHGLIGPNGSGKSTLMKCIVGDVVPTSGRIEFGGVEVTGSEPRVRSQLGMGVKFQITSVFQSLSVYDNILLALQARATTAQLLMSATRASLRSEVMNLLEKFHLVERRFSQASDLSHGEQQWLEIAMAMSTRPKLLILDEPTAGMSIPERAHTGRLLAPLKEDCAIMIVEHDLGFIRDISETLTVLDQGSIVETGSVAQIQGSDRVKEVYLTRV